MEIRKLADFIMGVLEEKKAHDIVKINVSDKTIIADYFIIASGRSMTQVKALAEAVEEKTDKEGIELKRREGVGEGRWAVLDYGDVIVHIFNDEMRLFYHLERLWQGDD